MSLPYKGFEVTACGSVREGLAAFRSRPFDLVLLDVNLEWDWDGSLQGDAREGRGDSDPDAHCPR